MRYTYLLALGLITGVFSAPVPKNDKPICFKDSSGVVRCLGDLDSATPACFKDTEGNERCLGALDPPNPLCFKGDDGHLYCLGDLAKRENKEICFKDTEGNERCLGVLDQGANDKDEDDKICFPSHLGPTLCH
ncbi:uncharacterized protein SPAPADRAFT_60191 [Spathaspora passalidarum NRRL Y-27907]|uniref:Uncharacterized protein n=1 Tax=Spathaspora passalidarum (strain NRRL Y-27907 / 11-Y1) TaxID=619300 RepID=G3AK38_SPAPN|nr:uncharacterized protein SPAPADRAFT_60191 [Spathaspora passalidarum NRRL Y-27907]EGW32849.1 hypothetical protein SPAPADRAFT_60191 [Spathaspora passalidarum NRRL Y-27907]